MIKSELRKLYKEKRQLLSEKEINRLNDLILIQFQHLDLPFVYYLHTYLAIEENREISTHKIVRYLEFRNPDMNVVAPKINLKTGEMINYLIDENSVFEKNGYNIPEPVSGEEVPADKIDLVLVPLLAFDEKGYRVGYGKGFYDRFLSQCRSDVLKIGLSYFDAVESIDDTHQFDLPLTYCITPTRIYEFD
ncbi:MAG TPA: 5-formyltetrahydrofolate cyclo-ligase [Chitinophagaceae bacterium]|nr:5-formyltetrahydrofolate cyclo-ligase [Chitinophagaceae bacterium]